MAPDWEPQWGSPKSNCKSLEVFDFVQETSREIHSYWFRLPYIYIYSIYSIQFCVLQTLIFVAFLLPNTFVNSLLTSHGSALRCVNQICCEIARRSAIMNSSNLVEFCDHLQAKATSIFRFLACQYFRRNAHVLFTWRNNFQFWMCKFAVSRSRVRIGNCGPVNSTGRHWAFTSWICEEVTNSITSSPYHIKELSTVSQPLSVRTLQTMILTG